MNLLAGKRVDLLRYIRSINLDTGAGQLKDEAGVLLVPGKDYNISNRASDNYLHIYDESGLLLSSIEFEK